VLEEQSWRGLISVPRLGRENREPCRLAGEGCKMAQEQTSAWSEDGGV
jgi:hypothetical protein